MKIKKYTLRHGEEIRCPNCGCWEQFSGTEVYFTGSDFDFTSVYYCSKGCAEQYEKKCADEDRKADKLASRVYSI